MNRISKRAELIPTSAVRKLAEYEGVAKAKGIEILHLNIGAPDLGVSSVFYEGIHCGCDKELGYAPSQGIPELLIEVSQYYKNIGAQYDVDEIFVTNGGSEGLLFLFQAICDVNDSILIPEPFYSNYKTIATMAEIQVNPIVTTVEEGFHLPSLETMEKAVTKTTKGILLSNPSNPTGVVYTEEEVMRICELAKKHDLWIIADEVYREFIYDGFITKSFSTIKEMEERVVIVDSISKRFSACGARIGLLLSKNKGLNDIIMKMCQSRLSVSTLNQVGAAKLYQKDMDYIKRSIPEYKKRRDLVYSLLSKVKGIKLKKPEGAFYIMATLPVADAGDFSRWLLTEFSVDGKTVMLTPGDGFYETPNQGLSEVRIAYVLNEECIKEAAEIIEKGLIAYELSKRVG